MQKISKKIVLVIVTIFLIIICNNFSFAVSTVTDRANSNTSQNSSSEEQKNEINNTENATTNELSENEIIEEHMELNYPDIKETENTFGPLTTEQIIGGSAALMALVGIILAISLYARSRENEEDDWNYEEENIETPSEREEPKAMKELKKEEEMEQPKAVQEMEDQKKIEEIKKAREESINAKELDNTAKNQDESKEKNIDMEDTNSLNYKHQKALDEFYNYAEEIKKESKPKRGKGKHSM